MARKRNSSAVRFSAGAAWLATSVVCSATPRVDGTAPSNDENPVARTEPPGRMPFPTAQPTVSAPTTPGTPPWTYRVDSEILPNPCYDDTGDDAEEDNPQEYGECDDRAKFEVVAVAANKVETVVYEADDAGNMDDASGHFSAIDGLADPNVRALTLSAAFGADFFSESVTQLLVRTSPEHATFEVLFEGHGSHSSEMDSCNTYDVLSFTAGPEGESVAIERQQATEFFDQQLENFECEVVPLVRIPVETVSIMAPNRN